MQLADVTPVSDGISAFAMAEPVHPLVHAESGVNGAQRIGSNNNHVRQPGNEGGSGDIKVRLDAVCLHGGGVFIAHLRRG